MENNFIILKRKKVNFGLDLYIINQGKEKYENNKKCNFLKNIMIFQ